MMKRALWFALALTVGSASCNDQQNYDENLGEGRVDATGAIALNLVGSDSQGRQYRLRNASFEVGSSYYPGFDAGAGSATTTLSTETTPDADYLSVRVVPGPYAVTLLPGWTLERETEQGVEQVAQVVLLSDARQQTWVYQNGVSEVFFRFGVDGDLIDFRHGDIQVGIEIELPDAGARDAAVGTDAGPGEIDAGLGDAGIDASTEEDAATTDAATGETDAGSDEEEEDASADAGETVDAGETADAAVTLDAGAPTVGDLDPIFVFP